MNPFESEAFLKMVLGQAEIFNSFNKVEENLKRKFEFETTNLVDALGRTCYGALTAQTHVLHDAKLAVSM